ncbi:RxLR effector protein [Phytophthora megakarya]|uniref:RxLR effector protein n=1 Tax=Phytophthora megakarya TaxID=4795 RepID=A0A225V1H8_9STRA|nr:RxLR effector protein [Phytophthora megakarya]
MTNDASWLDKVEACEGECTGPNSDPVTITKKSNVTLHVTACGVKQTVNLTEVYYAANLSYNLIFYVRLDKKG